MTRVGAYDSSTDECENKDQRSVKGVEPVSHLFVCSEYEDVAQRLSCPLYLY